MSYTVDPLSSDPALPAALADIQQREIRSLDLPQLWKPISEHLTRLGILFDQRTVKQLVRENIPYDPLIYYGVSYDRSEQFEKQDRQIAILKKRLGFGCAPVEEFWSEDDFREIEVHAGRRISIEDQNFLRRQFHLQKLNFNDLDHPERFIKWVDDALSQMETPFSKRDPILWNRLNIPGLSLKQRTAIFKSLVQRLERSIAFETMIQTKINAGHSHEDINFVIDTFFSRYSKGDLDFDPTILSILSKEINKVLERRKIGKEIARQCSELLRFDELDGAFKSISTELMKRVQIEQLGFERHLRKLETVDLYFGFLARAERELALLPLLENLSLEQIQFLITSNLLNPNDQAFIKGIYNKSQNENKPLADVIALIRRGHPQVIERLWQEIEPIQKEMQMKRPAELDYNNPQGPALRGLRAVIDVQINPQNISTLVEAGEWQNNIEVLEIERDLTRHELYELLKNGTSLNSDIAQQKCSMIKHFNQQIQEDSLQLGIDMRDQPDSPLELSEFEKIRIDGRLLQLEELSQNSDRLLKEIQEPDVLVVDTFFEDLIVIPPVGNVLFKTVEGNKESPPNGKWIVIDLHAVPKAQREAVRAKIKEKKPKEFEDLLQGRKHYDPVTFDFVNGELEQRVVNDSVESRRGQIRVFSEEPALLLNQTRDFGQRTRLVRFSNGADHGKYARQVQDADTADERQEMTAAVDRQIAVWISRLMIQAILQGEYNGVVPRDFLRIYDYVHGVANSDLSKRFNYLKDPIFSNAIHIFDGISEYLAEQTKENIRASVLRSDLFSNKKKTFSEENQSNVHSALLDLTNLRTTIFKNWQTNILTFSTILALPKHAVLKKRFSWYLAEFEAIKESLDRFLTRVPEFVLDATPEEGIGMIEKAIPEIRRVLGSIKMACRNIALAESSTALQEKRSRLLAGDVDLINASQGASNKVLTALARAQLPLKELLGNLSMLSLLHLDLIELLIGARQEASAAEKMRSIGRQELLSFSSETEARAIYYPKDTVVQRAQDKVDLEKEFPKSSNSEEQGDAIGSAPGPSSHVAISALPYSSVAAAAGATLIVVT